ncbi:MAG: MFS transporter [Akkermansiaceae bacterium]|nr:MFS transporter [Akkermansiaceae bacterium]MCF7730062.1 MFS transporter [Akkermansiaceae bacterium]
MAVKSSVVKTKGPAKLPARMNVSNPTAPVHPLEELPPAKITAALLGATLVGALGGLLFGFDTAVISGCQDQLKLLFQLTANEQGFMTASALIGAAIGSLAAAKPGDLYGRRDCLKIAAAFSLLCAIGCAAAAGLWMMIAARILGGIAVGATSALGPMYLAEMAPAAWRGRLVACFQVNIVLGVLVANFSNDLIGSMDLGAAEWRWMLGILGTACAGVSGALVLHPPQPALAGDEGGTPAGRGGVAQDRAEPSRGTPRGHPQLGAPGNWPDLGSAICQIPLQTDFPRGGGRHVQPTRRDQRALVLCEHHFRDGGVQQGFQRVAVGHARGGQPHCNPGGHGKEHFQQPDVLELLLPFVPGLEYGAELILEIPAEQMVIESDLQGRDPEPT